MLAVYPRDPDYNSFKSVSIHRTFICMPLNDHGLSQRSDTETWNVVNTLRSWLICLIHQLWNWVPAFQHIYPKHCCFNLRNATYSAALTFTWISGTSTKDYSLFMLLQCGLGTSNKRRTLARATHSSTLINIKSSHVHIQYDISRTHSYGHTQLRGCDWGVLHSHVLNEHPDREVH